MRVSRRRRLERPLSRWTFPAHLPLKLCRRRSAGTTRIPPVMRVITPSYASSEKARHSHSWRTVTPPFIPEKNPFTSSPSTSGPPLYEGRLPRVHPNGRKPEQSSHTRAHFSDAREPVRVLPHVSPSSPSRAFRYPSALCCHAHRPRRSRRLRFTDRFELSRFPLLVVNPRHVIPEPFRSSGWVR